MKMSLAEEISKYGSVAVVGLAKNTGKTVTLNHILRETHSIGIHIGVTSIGVDGESVDRVTSTGKPEITLYPGMHFATGEAYYRQRLLQSEVVDIGSRNTALGRVVLARALSIGKVLLSGPSDTASLKRLITAMREEGVGSVLVDGALSRLSPASPAVTEAMVLATGAALSPEIDRIVDRTAYVGRLIELPLAEGVDRELLEEIDAVSAIDEKGRISRREVKSALQLDRLKDILAGSGKRIFLPGMATERLLTYLAGRSDVKEAEIIVRDFTRIFAEPMTLNAYLARGGKISVLRRPRLLAITINPWSPQGYTVNEDKLITALRTRIDVPIYNLK